MSELPSSEDLDPSTGTDAPTPPTTTGPSSYTLNWEEPRYRQECTRRTMTTTVPRHRTAMARTALSRPLDGALDDGILDGATVFDFGCGRGDDLRRLAALGIACDGWDPAHRSDAERRPADVVNLGYVINVIEDPAERQRVLHDAWALTQRVLIVSARLTWDARGLRGRAVGDGIVTSTGTFQKFYAQQELRVWIEQTLQAPTLAAGPGIMYVFREPTAAQALLVERVRRSSQPPEPWVSEQLFHEHQSLLAPLIDFLTQRGRMPRGDELAEADAIRSRFGSTARAHAIIVAATGAERWEQLRKRHAANLLVYLALALFDRRPRFRDLPAAVQHDVREFFNNYKDCCAKADRMLLMAGRQDTVDLACCTSPVGKLTPTALYIHTSALGHLPPVLRVLEGCARTLVGSVPGTNLIKLHREEPLVSYLSYPDFDTNAHPPLARAVVVNLRKLSIDMRDYNRSANPPILHRKEEFLSPDDPRRPRYERLTVSEERHGLYRQPERIGTREGWRQVLDQQRVHIRGHRLYKSRNQFPAI